MNTCIYMRAFCEKSKGVRNHFILEANFIGSQWRIVNFAPAHKDVAKFIKTELVPKDIVSDSCLLPCSKCGGRVVGGCMCQASSDGCGKSSFSMDCLYCTMLLIDISEAEESNEIVLRGLSNLSGLKDKNIHDTTKDVKNKRQTITALKEDVDKPKSPIIAEEKITLASTTDDTGVDELEAPIIAEGKIKQDSSTADTGMDELEAPIIAEEKITLALTTADTGMDELEAPVTAEEAIKSASTATGVSVDPLDSKPGYVGKIAHYIIFSLFALIIVVIVYYNIMDFSAKEIVPPAQAVSYIEVREIRPTRDLNGETPIFAEIAVLKKGLEYEKRTMTYTLETISNEGNELEFEVTKKISLKYKDGKARTYKLFTFDFEPKCVYILRIYLEGEFLDENVLYGEI